MIEKLEYEYYLVSCDFCSHEVELSLEFMDVIERIKVAGWRIFKEDDEWMHKCPICAGNEDLFGA